MTDKEKIREEVKKLHGNPYYMMAVKDVLAIIDSLQEEPKFKIGQSIRQGNVVAKILEISEDGYHCDNAFVPFTAQWQWELVNEPFKMIDAAESLGILQEEYDRIVDECIYGKEPEMVDTDDLPKEVPVSKDLKEAAKDWLDVELPKEIEL